MERILKITIDLLRGATYDYETKFTQADSQSHYLQIDFSDTSLNFSGVSMKVNFIRSDGVAVTTSKASVTSSNKVQIPTNALAKFGELGIEIILIKGDSILTVNKLIRVTVIKTLAGEGIDLEIGDSFLNEINQLTVNLSKVLTGEGDKQIERVRATGNEVVKQVESILGNNPEGGNAAAVGGLSRAGIETLIDNVVGKVEDGKFPLTSAEVGKVYEAVNGKKYKCIKAYSGSSLSTPNANFIEMSLNNHADRLDNLSKYNFKSIGYFKNGEKIPSLEKYKLFYGLLILTQNISGVTHAQLPLIGVLKGNGVLQMQYNDNYYPEGSINFIIANNIVTISGGYFNANEERKLYSKLLLYGLEK
ncbi:MAG: hypothetical protein SO183_07350 [Fusobacterium mortiferum]|nr:hypothetical protein [Fusobacterium mortiferum]